MKKALFLLVLLISLINNAQTTLISDANFENKLIALGIDTNGFTGDILNVDAEAQIGLNVSNSNINDLTGVEAFINITQLSCRNNNLVSLDLSQNTEIANLYCSSNQLNFINVTQCIDLQDFNCSDNNLNALDVTNNSALRIINFQSNNFVNINLVNNTNLEEIYCGNNQLANLNVFAMNNLNRLFCPSNPLGNLDVTQNLNLLILNCGATQLNNLNVSNNINLTNLYCSFNNLGNLDVSNLVNLEVLGCEHNQINNLDVSLNLQLQDLTCNSNQIQSLDLSLNSNLSRVRVNTNQLTSLDIANGNNANISTINFNALDNINLDCIKVSDKVYANANWLAKIDPTATFRTACGSTAIPDGDFENKLIALGIDTNGFTGDILNEDAEAVIDLDVSNIFAENLFGIEAFINLETLNASNNNLGTDGDENFSQNTSLRVLNLQSNILDNLDVSQLTSLRRLFVDANNLQTLDVSNNTELRFLYCTSNQLNSINIGSIPNLADFRIYNNLLNSIDVSQLPQLDNLQIEINQLNTLDVSNNTLLTKLNCHINNLTTLDVSNNSNLTRLFCQNNQLTTLDIRNGNNVIIPNANFKVANNNLTCINVSDFAYANTNWNNIDAGVIFSTDCFPTTAVPDAAFESKLIILGIDTNGFTGDILNSDAELVNSLDVSNSFINDLAGIEAFINLTSLNCSNNNITTLNTSSSSLLNALDCSHNVLTSLNIFGNSILDILDCSFNNLATLNVIFNDDLVELNCTANNISSLNVASKNLLEKLECGANNLNSLDVLANLNLKRLSAYSNNIATIDVSNNIALTYISLANNQLNNLDVSANIVLTFLSCFNNNLTELDVSINTQLLQLQCYDNQLSALNMRNGNNSNIPTANFDATNNNLTCIKANDIPFATANWTNIDAGVTFELYCEPFTLIPDADFETKLINLGIDTNGFTGDILNSDATPIINLDISNFGIEDITGIEAFINLENLDAQQNLLTDVDFSQNLALRILNLKNNDINTINLTQNVDLTYLNLNSNQLLTIDVANNVSLETLGVFDNMLNSLNVTTNVALTNLNASSNNLGNIDLSNAILLEVLRLKSNAFVNLDLSNNIALVFLDLKVNQIANLDLTQNVNLITAKISNNTFNTIDLTPLVLLENLELRKTDISSIDLSQNIALKTLKIGQNFIRDLDVNTNVNLIDLTVNGGTTATSQARKIKTINFTQCVNLVNLDLNNNLLESLNLPNTNTLINLDVNTNNLVKLDFTHNTNLELITCSNNRLECLDLTNKTKLKECLAIDNDFHYINAKNANLVNWTTFKTTGNPNLTCINVDNAVFATANFGGTIDNTSGFSVDCYPSTIWNGANWSNGIPNATKTAVIKADYDTLSNGSFTAFELVVDANQTLTITKDLFINISHSITNLGLITVEHSGSFVQTLNCGLFKGNGDFYVGKKTNPLIDDNRFTYWSSPLEGQLLGNVLEYANQNQFYDFDAAIQDWNNVPNATEMLPSIGYVTKPLSNATFPLEAIVTFKGTVPHNGIYKTPVVFNAGGIDDDNNLIGNPYPSAINANFLFFENPNLNTLYFWTPNSAIVNGAYAGDDYATYSLAGGTAAVTGGPIKSKYIASCQGFFASTNASGNVTFKNNMRSSSFNNDFRNNEEGNDDKIWIDMYNDDGLFNQTLIAFLPNGTNDIDQGYDGLKYNSGNAISFYSLGGNQEQLVIQAKGLLRETETIPLGYHIGNETISTLKINIAQFENLENVTVYLKDNVLNITHDLKRGAYEFSVSETGNFNNRFELIFERNTLSTTNEVVNNNLIVFNKSETEIVVKMNNTSVIKSFVAYDILGKEVMRLKPNKSTFRIKTSLKQGTVLFIKVTLENDQVLLKKFLKN